MNLNDMAERSHTTSKLKGWWDEHLAKSHSITLITDNDRRDLSVDSGVLTNETITVKLALVVTEIAEAIECVRDGYVNTSFSLNGKPEGLPIEIADAVIRIGDLCKVLGIDLNEAVQTKMSYNATRPHRHGGKTL